MGFFSQDCEGCKHPALSHYVLTPINRWMNDVVAISPKGELHVGKYDGYGRVGSADEAIGWDATVWHVACWEIAGRPVEYRGASRSSADQGYFFDDHEHAMPDPRKVKQR